MQPRSQRAPARIIVHSFALAAAIALAACGGSTEPSGGGNTPPPKDVTPASITPSTTDTLRATVGSSAGAPLTVTVKNKAGDPLDTILVTFAVASGGGTVSNLTVRTNAAGQASTNWTLGSTAGVQTATATVASLAPVTFTAIAASGSAAAATKVAGDNQSAAAGATVAVAPSVKVTDQFGNPVSNTLVTFIVASGGGSVTGNLINTNAAGIATLGSWKLGSAVGTNTLTATVGAGNIAALTFTATATAGAAAQIAYTNTAPQLAIGDTFRLATRVSDANGNVIANVPVSFSSSDPTVATVNATTGTVTAVAAGTTTITASTGALNATQAVSVTGHPATGTPTVLPADTIGKPIVGLTVVGHTAFVPVLNPGGGVSVSTVPATLPRGLIALPQSPIDVAASANGGVAAAITGTGKVYFLDASALAVIDSMSLGTAPYHSVMNSSGTRLYVALNDFNLVVVDAAARTVLSRSALGGTVIKMKIVGDTSLFVATSEGFIYRVDARTGVVLKQLSVGTISDFDVGSDGKTVFTSNGSATVTMTPVTSDGLSGTVTFAQSVNGLAIAPDGQALWVSQADGSLFDAPSLGTTFQTTLVKSRVTLPLGVNPGQLAFTPFGDYVVVVDKANNNLIFVH
ncbi:MAG TPA: Ig-like domain-containing protein [Gemmatimonadaceae bacterium]|nr:Ig-like domain-containing protein [Gemmatimonadaceae bacterium]